jgi:signal transduction histidine kinase
VFLFAHSDNPPSRDRRFRPAWLILTIGFGGLLLCILAAAGETITSLHRVRGVESQARKVFLERLQALDRIRSQIYLSGTYVRDFLLSPDPEIAALEASHLSELKRQTFRDLDAYGRHLEAEEREPFQALRSEIEAYWKVIDTTVGWSPQQRSKLKSPFFYNELVPRRTAMLQVADRIASVNEQGLTRSEMQSAALTDSLKQSLLWTFAAAIAGGVVLALLTIGLILRLERELERRHADLQELSTLLMRAQENERRTLARELHDEIGQSLSAIMMETEGAECSEQSAPVSEHLAAIRSLADKTLNQVRDLALLLRPSMLDDLGLTPALNWHARETTKRTGRKVVVSTDEAIDSLPDEHQTCIYRLVQEAVNNAVRHASASTVEVAVNRERERVNVSVHDDGAGFDARHTRGLGLLGMEERVRRLGGRLKITSDPGRGTLVQAALPVAELDGRNGHEPHSHIAG